MVNKIGIIKTENFNPENYSAVVRESFTEHKGYKVLNAMEHYFNEHFEIVFDNDEDFETWKHKDELKYFILPLDLVPSIAHYADWVKEAYPDRIFDVVLERKEIIVEGQPVIVPTNILKMIPCAITNFNEEGEMLLEAVIESWNTQAPSKRIDFEVKFYRLDDLNAFIENAKQI